ncbi:MAG: hypothetical protein Q9163_001681 [Psora crenata]
MDKEYQELDRRLFDRRRRDGTACVLLHGQPGGGKSHLARQYVNKNWKKFNGGIFWIPAKSKEERYHGFWNIKQKVVARDAPAFFDDEDGNDFVKTVQTWFQSRHEWLIVFDGITLEKDEDASELVKFIPDSKNSSIIYISRAKNLESKQRLLRPFPIKVGPLKEGEAKELLFKTLHIKKPTDAEKQKASELVKKIGGLPLAIDAISHRLADTHEPLTKFKLSHFASQGLQSTYNQILEDLLKLGHTEAWNLINILCWFGPNIPVEMVHLGIRILKAEKVDVKTMNDGGRADIDNTFGILMRYALIERNEPGAEKESMSWSHDSLVEPEPIDMLKIHSVVQNFCCDSLNMRGLVRQWLRYAVKLFCFSYHQADIKIKEKPGPGRVSDYRYYLVHGQSLWDHSVAYESKLQSFTDVRAILRPILDMINEEIKSREPASSQEVSNNGVFQASIFDRTSSSSDSAPSFVGPQTPSHPPASPPLKDETLFGLPLDKSMDSPSSFGTASPGIRPKILGLHSPGLRPLEEDNGYDSDHEGLAARPSSRSGAPATKSETTQWQVVPSSNKPRYQCPRRNLGSFRPTLVEAQVDERSAIESTGRAQHDYSQQMREPSRAAEASVKAQSQSSASFRGPMMSFFQHNPFTKAPTVIAREPTWLGSADVKEPHVQQPRNKTGRERTSPSAPPLVLGRGFSTDCLQNQPRSVHLFPSPFTSEFQPHTNMCATALDHDQAAYADFALYPSDGQDACLPQDQQYAAVHYAYEKTGIGQSQPRPRSAGNNFPTFAPPPQFPNTAPLPLEADNPLLQQENRRHTQPPRFLRDLPSNNQPYTFNQSCRGSPSYHQIYMSSYPIPSQIPAGYTSQPMSRDQSHQSRFSVAGSEPLQYPAGFYPNISPYSSPPHQLSRSPRDGGFDGHFLGKSADHAFPRTSNSSNPSPKANSLFPSPSTPPLVSWGPYPPDDNNQAANISRSSSGGNLAMFPPYPPAGLGLVTLGDPKASLQFGQHSPISLEIARQRMAEHEVRLQERERGRDTQAPRDDMNDERWIANRTHCWKGRRKWGGRRRSDGEGAGIGLGSSIAMPYPEINLMPTSSDRGALEAMLAHQPGQGRRAQSSIR